MGFVTAEHYNVLFYACYRSSFYGIYYGFCYMCNIIMYRVMFVTGRPFVVFILGFVIVKYYSVLFYGCYRSSFYGIHYGFYNRIIL